MDKKEKNLLFAIICVLSAALCNTIMAFLVKVGLARGETIPTILVGRSLWGLVFLAPYAFLSPPRYVFFEKIKTRRIYTHIIRMISGFGAIFLFFYCAGQLSITTSSLLFFTIPLFMPIVAYVWKRQKIPHLSWVGLGLGFAGVIFIIKPGHDLFHIAAVIGVLSGLCGAISQFAVHLLAKTDSAETISLYYSFSVGVIALGLSFLNPAQSWASLTLYDYINFFGIGVFGLGYLLFMTLALKHGPPPLVSSFLYSAVLYAMILDWLVWGKIIDIYTLIGISLVVSGVVLKFYLHKKNARQ